MTEEIEVTACTACSTAGGGVEASSGFGHGGSAGGALGASSCGAGSAAVGLGGGFEEVDGGVGVGWGVASGLRGASGGGCCGSLGRCCWGT